MAKIFLGILKLQILYTIDRELIFHSILKSINSIDLPEMYYLIVNLLNSGIAVGLEVDPEVVPAAILDDEIDDEHDHQAH